MKKNIILSAAVGLVLSSCALFNPKPVTEEYNKPQNPDKNYNINGRISIDSVKKNNIYANYTWLHQNGNDNLELKTLIGTTLAQIKIESNIARLTYRNKNYTESDVDKLQRENMGFALPLGYLHYWIQGLPLPSYDVDKSLKDGFMQMGWTIRYLKWYDDNHPKVILLLNNEIRIKMLIRWGDE